MSKSFYRKNKNSIKENQFFSLPREANSLISKKRLVSITIFQINIYCVQRTSEVASNRSIALDFRKPYKKQRWSFRGRPWRGGHPRGHILKSLALALASKPQVLGLGLKALGPRKLPCPRLEDSTIF